MHAGGAGPSQPFHAHPISTSAVHGPEPRGLRSLLVIPLCEALAGQGKRLQAPPAMTSRSQSTSWSHLFSLFYEMDGVGGGQLAGRLCKLSMFILAGGPAGTELAGAEAFNRTRFL